MKPAGFAVIQIGYALFSVGRTEEEALRNAQEWADEPLTIVPYHQSTDGSLVLVPATEKLLSGVESGWIDGIGGWDLILDNNRQPMAVASTETEENV